MTLLAVDVGNTNIVCALYNEKTLAKSWRFSTDPRRTIDEYNVLLSVSLRESDADLSAIDGVVIVSVVPECTDNIVECCRQLCDVKPMVIGDETIDIGVEVDVDTPSEVGGDRLVNALSAYTTYKMDCIILDFGTATNFDVVSRQGVYKGGVIAPGVHLSLEALSKAASKLPRLTLEAPASVIGRSTKEAMRSGVYWGYVGLIEGLIVRIKESYGRPMKVIATGGLASLFIEDLPDIEQVNEHLTMDGLRIIYEKNR